MLFQGTEAVHDILIKHCEGVWVDVHGIYGQRAKGPRLLGQLQPVDAQAQCMQGQALGARLLVQRVAARRSKVA